MYYFFLFLERDETMSLGTETVNVSLYQPWMTYERNGMFGGMRTGRKKYSLRKLTPMSFCPAHIPHKLSWD
jgi:hypothetical protein